MLTPHDIDHFYEHGYVVVPKLFSQAECEALRACAMGLVAAFAAEETRPTVFSTRTHAHDSDRYFLASDRNISFFFEEEAFDDEGVLRPGKELALNKIGHALHTQHPVFREFSRQARIAEAVKDLGYLQDPAIIQSMYIFKQPYIGGEVTCHQDSTFLHTRPNRVLGVWFAIEEARQDNGCLWGLPGAYTGEPRQLFVRGTSACHFETLSAEPWDLSALVPLEVAQGSVILFHGLFPHMSYANRSPQSRHAYTIHVIDQRDEYPPSNWIRKGEANCLPLNIGQK